jgi:O-antigen ligase
VLDLTAAVVYLSFFCAAFVATRIRPAYGLVAMVAIDPFDFTRHVWLTTLTLPKFVLLGVALGLALGKGRASARVLATRPVRMLLIPCVAVATITAATAIPGIYIDAVGRETLKALEYLALFCAAAIAYAADPDEDLVWNAISIVTAGVALLALAQEVTGAPSSAYVGARTIPRIAGPLEGPNQLAGYLEIGICLLLARIALRRRWQTAATLAIAVLAAVLTLSRAGALGLGIGAVAVLARVGDARVRRGLAAVAVAAALAGTTLLARLGALGRFFAVQDTDYSTGLGTRSELWWAAGRFFVTHPILGIGAGNFEFELSSLGIIGVRTHANSLYLQSLAEGGVLLFAAIVCALGAAISILYGARERDAFALGAGAATIALAVHQVLDDLFFFPKVGGFWWICLGIAAASLALRRAPAAAR